MTQLVFITGASSGIGQALAGFLVDRVGARPVLFAALGCFVAAAASAALAQGYGGLLLAAALLPLAVLLVPMAPAGPDMKLNAAMTRSSKRATPTAAAP